jgi:2-dehydro-3-deoxygluconokinase
LTEPNTTIAPRPERFDLVVMGETMVAFVGEGDSLRFRATPAGAESNVAMSVARLGLRAQWVSRLGDDPLGRFVEKWIGEAGVDVAVVRDGQRPTGILTKHVYALGTDVRYYRSGSAASLLSFDDLGRAGESRWMHVTGITPALSTSAADLVAAVVGRRGQAARVSFDVNHRPRLWPDTAAAGRLILPLAQQADLVFIGDDEAEALFGTADTESLRALILRRDDQELVIKRGAGRASLVTRDGEISHAALSVDVVDVTGAGDAFAAGYLAATCFGWPGRARLQLGHVMAARVVAVLDDVPPPFTVQELADLSPDTIASRWADHGDET